MPDCSCYNTPKLENIYPNTINYTKRPQNIPKGRNLHQMAIKCNNIFHCKTLPILDFLFENIPSGNPASWLYLISAKTFQRTRGARATFSSRNGGCKKTTHNSFVFNPKRSKISSSTHRDLRFLCFNP
jgi:hypothetical protein